MKRIGLIATLFVVFGVSNLAAQQDDDDLLLQLVPIIAATADPATTPPPSVAVDKVKELTGRWKFDRGGLLVDFFDFSGIGITELSAGSDNLAVMPGNSYIRDDFVFLDGDGIVYSVYSEQNQAWVVLEPFGPPRFDLGSSFVLTQVDDEVMATHYFYAPSNCLLTSGIPAITTITKFLPPPAPNLSQQANRSELSEADLSALLNAHNAEQKLVESGAPSTFTNQQQSTIDIAREVVGLCQQFNNSN